MAIPVQPAAADSVELQAHEIVADIETTEPNARNRLAYHLYLFMKNDYPSVEEAVRAAKADLKEPYSIVLERITQRLRDKGFPV